MRSAFDDLLGSEGLLTIAFGIALGWSLYQVANSLTSSLSFFFTDVGDTGDFVTGTSLSWQVNGRPLVLGPFVWALVQFGLILLVALLVVRRRGRLAR